MFIAVLALRLTKYLPSNGYVDSAVQKGDIPGVPGCLEHASMIWDAIQRVKSCKGDLHVVWLDLANAYGALPHSLIWRAMESYHVPDMIVGILKEHLSNFHMRFTTRSYTLTQLTGLSFKLGLQWVAQYHSFCLCWRCKYC